MKVLDQGEVLLLDSMAGDHKVYGSARISTGKGPSDSSKGEEADRKLVHFLMKNRHGTPFEHAMFQWYVDTPIFVGNEWKRHRIGSFNEFSGRYAEFKPKFYVPAVARIPDPNNKQSSIDGGEFYYDVPPFIRKASEKSFEAYEDLIRAGVAREMARMVLPVNMYTQYWWTVNARSLMNFLSLRNHASAQWEIQQYGKALEEIFAEVMPWTYEAFVTQGRQAP